MPEFVQNFSKLLWKVANESCLFWSM